MSQRFRAGILDRDCMTAHVPLMLGGRVRLNGWRFNIPSLGDRVVPLGSTVDPAAVASAKSEEPAYLASDLMSIRRGIRRARGVLRRGLAYRRPL